VQVLAVVDAAGMHLKQRQQGVHGQAAADAFIMQIMSDHHICCQQEQMQ
jgi:hypothetical protein